MPQRKTMTADRPPVRRWLRRRDALTERERRIRFVVVALAGWVLMVLILRALLPISRDPITVYGPMVIFAGFALIVLGWRWRGGDERFCARCDQQVPPIGMRPEKCPECGAPWTEASDLVTGRLRRTPWMICLGALILAFAAIQFMLNRTPRPIWENAPTGLLISQIADPNDVQFFVKWDVLMNRELTDNEERRLLTALLDRRRDGGRSWYPAQPWVRSALASPVASDELVDRFYRESALVELHLPQRVRAGEPFEITAEVTRTFLGGGFAEYVHVWVGQVTIGGPDGARITVDRQIGISNPRIGRRQVTEPVTWMIDAPTSITGESTVTIELLYVAAPFNDYTAFRNMGIEDRPELDARATYTGLVGVEREIEVVE